LTSFFATLSINIEKAIDIQRKLIRIIITAIFFIPAFNLFEGLLLFIQISLNITIIFKQV